MKPSSSCGDYCGVFLLSYQSSIHLYWAVLHCSTWARRQNLLHLWYLRGQPDARAPAAHRAPAEGEGRFTQCGRGPGALRGLAAGSEGRGRHPAGRTVAHCDHTHTGLGVKKHAGPNPNKTMTICCSCHASLQQYSQQSLMAEESIYLSVKAWLSLNSWTGPSGEICKAQKGKIRLHSVLLIGHLRLQCLCQPMTQVLFSLPLMTDFWKTFLLRCKRNPVHTSTI